MTRRHSGVHTDTLNDDSPGHRRRGPVVTTSQLDEADRFVEHPTNATDAPLRQSRRNLDQPTPPRNSTASAAIRAFSWTSKTG